MNASIYRFRNFRLDPRTRELHRDGERLAAPISTIECLGYLIRHRDRSIGRDELVAAVWGRSDVSDVSLSHAIMRARRLLGDTGSEQRSIRTLPRLGYRWVVEPTIEEPVADERTPTTEPAVDASAGAAASGAAVAPAAEVGASTLGAPKRNLRAAALVAALAAGAAALAIGTTRLAERAPRPTPAAADGAAMVLPAQVDASPDWAWLRLGAMDLIANRLRSGGLATTPSETVVRLVDTGRLDASRLDAPSARVVAPGMLLVRPAIRHLDDHWQVGLRAVRDEQTLQVEASAPDVLVAARRAADDLLLKLGRTPPLTAAGYAATSPAELAQRVQAAVLGGQTGLAATLIAAAPAPIAAAPEIALAQADLDYAAGRYADALRRTDALLDRLPATQSPLLRAHALNRRGATRCRLGDRAGADRDFVDAIALLELQNDAAALAAAYAGRGVLAGMDRRWDEAVGWFGRARSLRQMSGDAFGVANADLNLAAVEIARGRPAAAAPLFEAVARRLEEIGTPEALAVTLRDLANAELLLMRYDDALATTSRFWPAAAHSANARERWSLTLTRAAALAMKGRLQEADALIDEIERASDPVADAFERADAMSLAAYVALQRGENRRAAELAARALTPEYAATNALAYATAWLERVRGLQRSGEIAAAADEVARVRAWAKSVPDERVQLLAALTAADQAAAESGPAHAQAGYAALQASAERIGIPEYLVLIGEPYVESLLAANRVDDASAIAGRLGAFSAADAHAARAQALVYASLNKPDAAAKAYAKALELAGEARLPPLGPPSTH
ncbi:MAG TPA: winged helix-turn-helix domain-containing protein [Dokdonella sp.]